VPTEQRAVPCAVPRGEADPGRLRRPDPDPRDRTYQAILLLGLLALFGLLANPYWVPSGDGEFYVAAARSIALGQGYRFNGLPIGSAPPGWPAMMAAVMKITPYVLPLKLLTMGCMIASLMLSYRVVRRFVGPPQALAVILLTAALSHVFQATFWLMCESAFCLATTASILVAMQLAEGRRQAWRIALLLALCAAAVTIRLAGLLNLVLVVAVLLDRELKPRPNARWAAAALVTVVTVGTFLGWWLGLRVTRQEFEEAAGVTIAPTQEAAPTEDLPPLISGSADQTAHSYSLFPRGSYPDRFLNWGHWFSYVYWQVFRAAGGSRWIAALSALLGWSLIALLGTLVLTATRRRQWIWLATGMYSAALAMNWGVVTSRYYVPVAFLVTLGVFLVKDQLLAWAAGSRAIRRTVRALFGLFVGSVVLVNAAIYAVDLSIARSKNFYDRYEAGLAKTMVAACQYLDALQPDQQPRDRQVAVSQRYTNLGRSQPKPSALRVAVLLTGKAMVTPRFKDTAVSPDTPTGRGIAIRKWLASHGIRYYLWQPPISPWRVWHFRVGWFEKARTGRTADVDTSGWQLFRIDLNEQKVPTATRIPLPEHCQPVTRIPGL
jgi:hypothetical protein